MSELKTVFIKKTVASNVYFTLSPLSNQQISKEIYLTDRMPQQALPIDWALGIFVDGALYDMFKQGYFTFSDVDAVVNAAIENGVYFDEVLDFKPASSEDVSNILNTLKSGNRSAIQEAINKYGRDKVGDVAVKYSKDLTTGVVSMLESALHMQLILDGAAESDYSND